MTTRHHGISMYDDPNGTRPIASVDTSIICIWGTAPGADATKFPYYKPVLFTRRADLTGLGATGTAPWSLDAIYKQGSPYTVFIRVPEPSAADNLDNIIGGINDTTGEYEGIYAARAVEAATGLRPRIFIAPGFTHHKSVLDAMVENATALRGMIYADGPNTTDAEAIAYRNDFGSKYIKLYDPHIKTTFNGDGVTIPVTPLIAGARAVLDNAKGSHWSLSNYELIGVEGLARTIDYNYMDASSRANLLNNAGVATVIRKPGKGFLAWGNRTCASDPKWAFESVVREVEATKDSIQMGIDWATDNPIDGMFFANVANSVNAYLRYRKNVKKAILGGTCWVTADENTPDILESGEANFHFDLTVPAPAEHIGIGVQHVNDYYKGIIPADLLR